MNDLPKRETLLKEYEMILGIYKHRESREKKPLTNGQIKHDALCCLAGVHHCSVKELKNILFN